MYQGFFYALGAPKDKSDTRQHWIILFSASPIDESSAIAMAQAESERYASTIMLDIESWSIHTEPTAEVKHGNNN